MSIIGFGNMEQRLNNRAMHHLANRMVTVGAFPACMAIYDAPGTREGLNGLVETYAPSVRVKDTDVPAPAHGMPVSIGAQSYVIAQALPDGVGYTRLELTQP